LDTARVIPPLTAMLVDGMGFAVTGDSIAVMPGGFIPSAVAVASLVETLAVAWVESLDPSAPTIAVQIVEPDGTLGAAATIATNEAWLSGRLRLVSSQAENGLLAAWESEMSTQVGIARIDCIRE
jgi:hypothetical protein